MKKVFFTILCLTFYSIFFQNTQIFANEKSGYHTQFDLLENYLTKHKQKIILFKDKYDIHKNNKLDTLLNEIENLTEITQKIKSKNLEGYNSSEISVYIVKKIKFINEELKTILTEEKKKYLSNLKKKHEVYSNIGVKAGNHLISIIEKIANNVNQSNIDIESKMKIIIHLKNLQKNSQKLRDFGNISYESEQKLQNNFVFILKEIRNDMQSIKKILKK